LKPPSDLSGTEEVESKYARLKILWGAPTIRRFTARCSRLKHIRAYTDRNTDVTEKYFARVDVTENFPFLVTKLSPYYDR
jgi:hypothetical protein